MFFEDRILVNPRLLRLKNPQTNEVIDWEIQDYEQEEIVQEGTEINAQVMNEIQTTVVDNLNSTSQTDALSAKQGKVLKEFLTPTILYQNSNGESSTVNLSDDVANYERIEITFRVNTVLKTAIWEKHESKPYCVLDFVDFYNDQLIFCAKIVDLSGTTITPYRQKRYTIRDSETWTPYGSADSGINIIAVRGYKY